MLLSMEDRRKEKMREDDRILKINHIDGIKPLNSIGLPDPRLFTGENNLHVVMDTSTCLWSFKYDIGNVPPVLKENKYTSFNAALKHARNYFKSRGLAITEVID